MSCKSIAWSAAFMAVIIFALVSARPVAAQRLDGTISGTVKDSSGAVVPAAAITVVNDQTGATRETTASQVGFYTVPNLLVGSYTVKIEATGFAPYTRTAVQVQATQVAEVSAELAVGSLSQTIQVTSGADLIQAQSSQLTKSFGGRMVEDLPMSSGSNTSVLNLAIYLPNTTTALGGTSGTGGSIGGLRGRQNAFTVDGVNNNDPQVTIASQQVIPDAVQEFSLSTNQFSAEFGTAAGGQFNVVTKRGTNQMHGGAWMYNSNRNYNARSNLSDPTQPKPRYDFNRLGGQVGGPILKNRWFIYGAYEYQTQGQAVLGTAVTMPTAAGLDTLKALAANDAVRSIVTEFPTAPTQSGTTPVTVGGTTTQIPIGQVSLSAPNYYNQHDYIINSDLNLSKHSVRWGYISTRRREPAIPDVPQEKFIGIQANDNQKVTFGDVWVANTRLVSEFRASMSRLVTSAGLDGFAATFPTVTISAALGALIGPLSNYPQHRTTNQYQLLNQMNYLIGRHSLKWGGEYRWFTSPSEFLQHPRGYYIYSSLTNLLNDQVPANQQLQGIGSGTFVGNASNYSFFVQDDFKLTPRFTVNAGLRYEFFGNPAGARRQALNSVADLPEAGLIWKVPLDDRNNFAPRLGFAWDLLGNSKWALRGGAGASYDAIPFNFLNNAMPPQHQLILTADSACAGQFAAPPAWCASYLADGIGVDFLSGGAMKLAYNPPTDQATARSLSSNLMSDARNPKVYSWSLGVQHELFKETTIEVRYLGTRGLFLPVQTQLNTQTAFQRGASPLPTWFSTSEIPAMVAADSPTLAQFLAARGYEYSAQGFATGITSQKPVGRSTYHGGAVDLNRRFNRGFLFRANYTWAKAMDDSTNDLATSVVNPRRPQNWRNMHDEWSRSTLDVRHKAAFMWIYDFPKVEMDSPVLRGLLGGWQLNGTYLFQSGQPITVQSGVDSNGNRDSAGDRAILNPNGTDRVGTAVRFVCRDSAGATSVASSAAGCGGTSRVIGYIAANPQARYVQAGQGAVSNVGRNTVDSEHFNLWNMSLFKNTRINEGKSLQFRFEVFNVFNVSNYTLGNADVAPVTLNTNARSTSYANVSAAQFLNSRQFDRQGRSIQLGLKFAF